MAFPPLSPPGFFDSGGWKCFLSSSRRFKPTPDFNASSVYNKSKCFLFISYHRRTPLYPDSLYSQTGSSSWTVPSSSKEFLHAKSIYWSVDLGSFNILLEEEGLPLSKLLDCQIFCLKLNGFASHQNNLTSKSFVWVKSLKFSILIIQSSP